MSTIGNVTLSSPFLAAPLAGITSAFFVILILSFITVVVLNLTPTVVVASS